MKTVGFITEFTEDFFAKPLIEYLEGGKANPKNSQILQFLEKGVPCVPIMGMVEDMDEEIMGYCLVKTDGVWFWPEYLSGFLKKYPEFKLPDDFQEHAVNNRHKKVQLSQQELLKFENEFWEFTGKD